MNISPNSTRRQYGDMVAWLEQPRDYVSLESSYRAMHGEPMPAELQTMIVLLRVGETARRSAP